MKVKLNLDKNAIQSFLLEHVEKIVLAGVAVCVLLMVYSALFGRERFDKTPDKTPKGLSEKADQAEKHWLDTPPNDKTCVLTDYPSVAKRSQDKIDEKSYRQTALWNTPIIERQRAAEGPRLFAVEDLRGVPGRGAFHKEGGGSAPAARTPAAAGPVGATKGYRWVVLTGAIPARQQYEAIKQCYEGTILASKHVDPLAYHNYRVERAEINGQGTDAELVWTPLDVSEAVKSVEAMGATRTDQASRTGGASEVPVVFPLPQPATGPGWDFDDIEHPRIVGPSLKTVNRDPDAYKGQRVTWMGHQVAVEGTQIIYCKHVKPLAGGAESECFAMDYGTREAAAAAKPERAVTGVVEGKAVARVPGFDRANSPGTSMPLLKYEGDRPATAAPAASGTAGAPRPGAASTADATAIPEYQLFRFCDCTVEPGKRYRYRVRLMVPNPLYNVSANDLANPSLGKTPELETEASKPTDVIAVPRDTRLLVLSVSPPRSMTDSSAKIVVYKWVDTNGLEAYKEFTAIRGLVPEFKNDVFPPPGKPARPAKESTPKPAKDTSPKPAKDATPKPARDTSAKAAKKDTAKAGDTAGSAAAGKKSVAPPAADTGGDSSSFKVDYITDSVILDMHGGETIAGRDRSLKELAEVLILDPDGNLRICNELEDKVEYDRCVARLSGSKAATTASGGSANPLGDM